MVVDDTKFYRVLMFDSEEHYTRLIARLASTTDPAALNNRALAHAELGDVDSALVDFTAALAAGPADSGRAVIRVNRGAVLEQLGRIDEAIADYRAATVLAPATPQYHRILAGLLHDQARFDEAVIAYDAAIALEPDFQPTRDERDRALARRPPA